MFISDFHVQLTVVWQPREGQFASRRPIYVSRVHSRRLISFCTTSTLPPAGPPMASIGDLAIRRSSSALSHRITRLLPSPDGFLARYAADSRFRDDQEHPSKSVCARRLPACPLTARTREGFAVQHVGRFGKSLFHHRYSSKIFSSSSSTSA